MFLKNLVTQSLFPQWTLWVRTADFSDKNSYLLIFSAIMSLKLSELEYNGVCSWYNISSGCISLLLLTVIHEQQKKFNYFNTPSYVF